MAHLDFYTGDPARIDDISLSGISGYQHREFSSSLFRWYDDADNGIVLFGDGLTYTEDGSPLPDVTGGRVTGLLLETAGGVVWLFSGLDISARALFARLEAGDDSAVRALLLSGDDQIGGSLQDDSLRGGLGNDYVFGRDGDDSLSGNDGNDSLYGGSGRDWLSGGDGDDELSGNAGFDRLRGGEGSDRFVFANTPVAGEGDRVLDFTPGEDIFVLNRGAMPGIGAAGPLDPARFGLGDVATTNAQRILWDDATGTLRYDPDGARPADAVVIARATPGLHLTAADFEVYYSVFVG